MVLNVFYDEQDRGRQESEGKSQTSIPRIIPRVSSCHGDEFDKNTDGDSQNESALQGEHTRAADGGNRDRKG